MEGRAPGAAQSRSDPDPDASLAAQSVQNAAQPGCGMGGIQNPLGAFPLALAGF